MLEIDTPELASLLLDTEGRQDPLRWPKAGRRSADARRAFCCG